MLSHSHRNQRVQGAPIALPTGRAWRGWLWILLMICLLALFVKTALAAEVLLRTADGPSPQTPIPWIPLIAAFGVGSIVAAIVGWASARAVAISNHRQNWINGLREDIVAFLKEIDLLHFRLAKMNRGGDTDDIEKQQELRASALLIRRRIRLRLNMTESPSHKLDEALESLMTIDSNVANLDRVETVIKASAVVLKQEWAVTKYGSLAGLISDVGTMYLRRWLNAAGLFLGIVGVVFIFVWGPPQPTFLRGDSITASPNTVIPNDGRTVAQRDADTAAQELHYTHMSQIGLSLILAGFLLQFANEFFRAQRTGHDR